MSKPDTDGRPLDYDVMVVGAGVAGMETAASMGDMGYRVLLVGQKRSVGGGTSSQQGVPDAGLRQLIVTPKWLRFASSQCATDDLQRG